MTNRQRLFIIEYLKCWNASKAAELAGYTGRPNTVGPRLLANVVIKAEIERQIAERAMSADEVLQRLAEMARGDLGDAIVLEPARKGSKHLITKIDWGKLVAAGKTHLVKKFKVTKDGVEIELHDPQRALELLGKHHRLFVDQAEVTTNLAITFTGNADPDDV